MAEEKKIKGPAKWFREMRSELKKVTWPSGKVTMKNTLTVLLCSLVVGACIWIFDAGLVGQDHLEKHITGKDLSLHFLHDAGLGHLRDGLHGNFYLKYHVLEAAVDN